MAVSYKKLFKILIDRDMKKKDFREYVGISYSTLSKLEKGENTNVDVLERICLKMDCRIEDIMEISGIKNAAFEKIKDDITV